MMCVCMRQRALQRSTIYVKQLDWPKLQNDWLYIVKFVDVYQVNTHYTEFINVARPGIRRRRSKKNIVYNNTRINRNENTAPVHPTDKWFWSLGVVLLLVRTRARSTHTPITSSIHPVCSVRNCETLGSKRQRESSVNMRNIYYIFDISDIIACASEWVSAWVSRMKKQNRSEQRNKQRLDVHMFCIRVCTRAIILALCVS